MNCPACQRHYPEGVKCCAACGLEFKWEHKESQLPLRDLNVHTPSREVRFERLVRQHLEGAEQEGWQANGPVEWDELLKTGRIQRGKESLGGGPPIETYRTAKVPLKKLHLIRRPVEDFGQDPADAGMTADEAVQRLQTG